MNVNLKMADHIKMPCQPDILIVPSKLTCFAKKVSEHSLVLNPGHLTRDTTGGTYAVVEIHPFASDALEGTEEMRHQIPDRTKVEIRRI